MNLTWRRRLAALTLAAGLAACGAPSGSEGSGSASTAPAPLLLLSFDGFRWDYLEKAATPNFDRLVAEGVRARGLVPVFPSKTFPAHYSIVTGLHPGHHGILSNNMRDPRWPETFSLGAREEVQNERWWGGEPIWATAQRQGLRSAVYFWPGSEAPVNGVQPDVWSPYDAGVPWAHRVDTALEWLDQPAAARPHLIALYFEEPNSSGHQHGPDSSETVAAIETMDGVLRRLLDGLDARGGIEAHNVVIVSDHGMAANDPARVIVVEDLVELEQGELFEFGALLQIYPNPGREETIYAQLRDAHPNLRVFRPAEAPAELHLYEHPRLPPIMATPDPGWEVLPRRVFEQYGVIAGDHGQDPSDPDMHGIFLAAGPAFARGVEVAPVHGVDVYGLLAAALGVEPAPNDGDPARTAGILRRR